MARAPKVTVAEDNEDPPAPEIWNLPLLEFIERASSGRFKAPTHLHELAEEIEAAERLEGVRTVGAAPVQHGKTMLLVFAIAWILLRHPDRPIIYITYGARFSERQSRRIRAIYLACGGRMKSDFNTIHQWETDQGGGLLATSSDGEVTGNDAVHVFYDDPYKNRQEAESPEFREVLEEKFSSEVVTRVTPGGSIMIIASRWHEDDLSGTKIREGYKHVHLRAITTVVNADGTTEESALCEWGPNPKYPRTLAFLRSLRDGEVNPYDWASLYQGEPRPKGGGLFRDVFLYASHELPNIIRVCIGCDFAYSATGDWIAVVVLGLGDDGVIYVLMVWRWQRSILENLSLFRAVLTEHAGATCASYVAGPEVGVIRYLARIPKSEGGAIMVQPLPAVLSKYVRAGRTASRWNRGGIRVLRGAPWAESFIRVVCGFTGLDGGKDDEVDALVSGHDRLMLGETFRAPGGGFRAGKRCM